MFRNINSKLIATGLVVASFGLAATAHAEDAPQGMGDGDVAANIVEGEIRPGGTEGQPTAPGGTEEEPVVPGGTEEEPVVPGGTEGEEETGELDLKGNEAKQRFKQYCLGDYEPSHNDREFCEMYRKAHGIKGPFRYEQKKYQENCTGDAKPDGITKRFCDHYRHEYLGRGGTGTGGQTGGKTNPEERCPDIATEENPYPSCPDPTPVDPIEPTGSHRKPQVQEPSKGTLPFTGLEIWQLALLGAALSGGGLAARRLLAG